MMENKILFLIDCQNDFIDGGSLAVNDSIGKMEHLSKFIKEHKDEYSMILASVDWHPFTHCSFKVNGGIWPVHCVQHSVGAAIFKPILDAINETKLPFYALTKGTNEDHEEYSVMKNYKSNKKIHSIINSVKPSRVDFCGLAGEYCVKNSMSDFHREFHDVKIGALIPFIGSIDGGKEFSNFLYRNDNIEQITDV